MSARQLSGGLLLISGVCVALLCGGCIVQIWLGAYQQATVGLVMTSTIDGRTNVTHLTTPVHFGSLLATSLLPGLPALLGLTSMAYGLSLWFEGAGRPSVRSRADAARSIGPVALTVLAAPGLSWAGSAFIDSLLRPKESTQDPFAGLTKLFMLVFVFVAAFGFLAGSARFEAWRKGRER